MNPSPVMRPVDLAEFSAEKMGKTTLYRSEHVLVGLNAFEPGQSHALHAHAGMDKVYHVLQGAGTFLLGDAETPMTTGDLMIAPADVPHGIRNDGTGRLVVLAILTPAPEVRP